MFVEDWLGLLIASKTWAWLSAIVENAMAFAGLVRNYVKNLRERSLLHQSAIKMRARLELIRQRRNKAFWEGVERRWGKPIEVGIILTLVLMPVLNSWGTLLVLTLLLLIIRSPGKKPRDTGLFIFWLALVISALMAVGIGGFGRLATVTIWLLLAGLTGRVFTAEFSRKVIRFSVIAGLIWMVIGLWQQVVGVSTPAHWLEQGQSLFISVRSYSVFGNPNIYGLYLVSILCFAFAGTKSGEGIYPAVSWVVLVLALVSLFFTYSRTAWLLSLLGLILWSGKGFVARKRFIFLWWGLFLMIPGFKARIGGLSNLFESTFWFRVQIWRNMPLMIADFLWWGAGPGSFHEVYRSYLTGMAPVEHGHQLYLQLWLESGLFSLAAFFRVIAKNMAGLNRLSSIAKATALVIVLWLIAGFLETWWVHQFMGGYFWLLFGLLQSQRMEQIDS